MLFPHGLDANEYARRVTPAPQSLALLIKSAEGMCGPTRVDDVLPTPRAADIIVEPPKQRNVTDDASSLAVAHSATDAIDFTFGDRQYRVRGLDKNLSFEQMKIVLRVARAGVDFIDSVDLVSARQRAQFIKQASVEVGVKEEILRTDIAKVRGQLDARQEEAIKRTLEPKKETAVVVAGDDEREALELYRNPQLVDRIVQDFNRCGFVGERTNKVMAYLAAISRKLDEPLAIIVQSSSAAGKPALMDAVLAFDGCSRGAGTLVLGWRSEDPLGTSYDILIDGKRVRRVLIKDGGTAEVEDDRGQKTDRVGPLQIYLSGGNHEVEVRRNGASHWRKTIVVGEPETEFYYSLSNRDGETATEDAPA
ncbi:MAG TPA: hypothetical protein VEK79_24515 [Thermoanaerobaculia bacterium]|nr:hypothetical protein [Thermoanaerobaculia bacterium]